MTQNLYIVTNAQNLALANVKSHTSYTIPQRMQDITLGDILLLNVYLADGAGGYDSSSGAAGYVLKIGVGLPGVHPAAALQTTWTPIANGWTGSLALNTTGLSTLLGTAQSMAAIFEVLFIDPSGNQRTIAQLPVTLRNDVVDIGSLVPPPTVSDANIQSTGSTTPRSLSARFAETINVKDYGAKGNARYVTDASISAGFNVLSSAQAGFVSGDVGKSIAVAGAGPSGGPLLSTIIAVGVNQCTLAVNATGSVASANCEFGSDDTTLIQAAINAAPVGAGGVVIYFPPGVYRITAALHLASASQRLIFRGSGKEGSNCTKIVNTIYPNANLLDLSTPYVSDTASVYDMQFQGAGKGTGTGKAIVLGSSGTTMYDSQIARCWFVNIPNTCIYGIRVADYQITECGIEGAALGIWIDGTGVGGSYVNYIGLNSITQNTFYSLDTAVKIQFDYATKISDNIFQICGTDVATNGAIYLTRGSGVTESRNHLIATNVFDRNWNDIYLEGGGTLAAHEGLNGVLVVGNISDFANRSFAEVNGANEVSFVGNKINDCSAAATSYPAIHVKGTVSKVCLHGNFVTKSGSFGPTYGLYCEVNVSGIVLGHNRWLGATADVRLDGTAAGTVDAKGDVQTTAIAIQETSAFGSVTLPLGYSFGLYGASGSVLGAVGNIKSSTTGKQFVFGYDFTNDRGILNAADQGVGYKSIWINNGFVTIDQTNLRVGIGTTQPGYALSFGSNNDLTFALFENAAGANLYGIGYRSTGSKLAIFTNGVEVADFDTNATAGNTRFLLWDVTAAALKRVSVGATDSGGTGFKLLRVPN